MREMWETPRIPVQAFVPSEYCASACFTLACVVKQNKMPTEPAYDTRQELWGAYGAYNDQGKVTVDGTEYEVQFDHGGSCANANNNAIQVNGNQVDIVEYSSDQGRLNSELITSYDKTNNGWGLGDLFSWVTFGGLGTADKPDRRIWLHWAYAGEKYANHPNRS